MRDNATRRSGTGFELEGLTVPASGADSVNAGLVVRALVGLTTVLMVSGAVTPDLAPDLLLVEHQFSQSGGEQIHDDAGESVFGSRSRPR